MTDEAVENTMKALVWYDNGCEKMELREVPVPEISDEDILVEVKAVGICGSDVHNYYGASYETNMPVLPVISGHEFTGVIVKKGSRVHHRWKLGDRVVSDNTGYACGVCPACERGDFVNCEARKCIGWHMDGAFAKYVRIPGEILKLFPNTLLKLPDKMSFTEAACLEITANMYKALIQEGGMLPGDNVVIYGAGPMALVTVQLAKAAGAAKIIVIGMSADREVRFLLAEKFGASICLASDEEADIVERVKDIAGDNGVAVALDIVGHPAVTSAAIDMVRNEGTVIYVGNSFQNYNHNLMPVQNKSVTFRGHMGYNAQSWRNVMSMASVGLLDLKSLATHVLPLDHYKKGFELLRRQEAAKVVLIP